MEEKCTSRHGANLSRDLFSGGFIENRTCIDCGATIRDWSEIEAEDEATEGTRVDGAHCEPRQGEP